MRDKLAASALIVLVALTGCGPRSDRTGTEAPPPATDASAADASLAELEAVLGDVEAALAAADAAPMDED